MNRQTSRPMMRTVRKQTKAGARSAILVGVVAALVACSPLKNGPKQAISVEEAHPIQVDSEVASMMVPLDTNPGKLSPQTRHEVRAFLASYKSRGHGAFSITKPGDETSRGNAARVARAIDKLADELGVGDHLVTQAFYTPEDGQNNAPIILSYLRYVATASACGDWSDDAATSYSNTRMPNFGCATQNNLAAMVIDPRDLQVPRTLDPADVNRRQKVIEDYRSGQSTGSERTEQESGQVSEVE